MADPRIAGLQQLQSMASMAQNKTPMTKEKSEVSFQEMMKKYVNDANEIQLDADDKIKRIIAGEDIDTHEVMIAAEKAEISFNLLMELRNKMLEAYREVVKSQV